MYVPRPTLPPPRDKVTSPHLCCNAVCHGLKVFQQFFGSKKHKAIHKLLILNNQPINRLVANLINSLIINNTIRWTLRTGGGGRRRRPAWQAAVAGSVRARLLGTRPWDGRSRAPNPGPCTNINVIKQTLLMN